MRTPSLILLILFLVPAFSFAQSTDKTSGSKSQKVYQKKTSRTKVSTDSSDVTAILKDSANAESGPILRDNGSISTTGNIDGRSSTGRPDADTTSYTVKKSKKTITTGGSIMPDTSKKKTAKP